MSSKWRHCYRTSQINRSDIHLFSDLEGRGASLSLSTCLSIIIQCRTWCSSNLSQSRFLPSHTDTHAHTLTHTHAHTTPYLQYLSRPFSLSIIYQMVATRTQAATLHYQATPVLEHARRCCSCVLLCLEAFRVGCHSLPAYCPGCSACYSSCLPGKQEPQHIQDLPYSSVPYRASLLLHQSTYLAKW